MDWFGIVTTGLSVIIGGLIAAYFSRRYYVKASQDLTREAEEFRHYSLMIIKMLDEDMIDIRWNHKGYPMPIHDGVLYPPEFVDNLRRERPHSEPERRWWQLWKR